LTVEGGEDLILIIETYLGPEILGFIGAMSPKISPDEKKDWSRP